MKLNNMNLSCSYQRIEGSVYDQSVVVYLFVCFVYPVAMGHICNMTEHKV